MVFKDRHTARSATERLAKRNARRCPRPPEGARAPLPLLR
jgi:hypothetical protein